VDDWSRVIWSDETKINRFTSDGHLWCWIRDGEQMQSKHVKQTFKHGGGNIKIWSCITFHGVGWLTKIDNILDKELYQKILEDELFDTIKDYQLQEEKVIFQHDNDPKHTAQSVQQWLSSQKFSVMKWPAQSPDLNPIENMWAILKMRLNQFDRAPKGMSELFECVTDIWYNITAEECQKVIESMPKRCQEVIKAKGGWTHY
jgi:DDE superfamily endonuclease